MLTEQPLTPKSVVKSGGFLRNLGGARPTTQIRQRLVNLGFVFLRLHSPFLEAFWPSAWAVLRYLHIRHYRGQRYRLGLPSRGQRTHTNAATTRHVRTTILTYIRSRYWFSRL